MEGREFSKNDYQMAFSKIIERSKLPENYYKMLQYHYSAPSRKLSPPELAKLVGYKSYSAVNLHYGKLGKMICDELSYIPPDNRHGDPTWTFGLAWGERENPVSEWVWTMYANLAAAIKELGIVR